MNARLSPIDNALISNDLSGLTPSERWSYYVKRCEAAGLDPMTQPFSYLVLDGKLTLYVNRAGAEQLRTVRGISVYKLDEHYDGATGEYTVTAYVRDRWGREDVDMGIVSLLKEEGEWKTNERSGKRFFEKTGNLIPLSGQDRINSKLKAVTKAKRRATISISGLGMQSEEEVDDIRGAKRVEPEETLESSIQDTSNELPFESEEELQSRPPSKQQLETIGKLWKFLEKEGEAPTPEHDSDAGKIITELSGEYKERKKK